MRTQHRGRKQLFFAWPEGERSFLLRAQQGFQSVGQHCEGGRTMWDNTEQQQSQPVLPGLAQ